MSRLRSQSNADWSTNDIVANTQSARQRLEFAYDSQSRRVRKAVYQRETLNQQPETWVLKSDLRFVYDAWNLLAEFNMKLETANLELLRSYAWGYDLSGTEQGAGGVGGLVLVKQSSTTVNNSNPPSPSLAPCYDGNGNILAYLDCTTGTITQRMEYDAFGNEMSLDSVLTQPSTSSSQLPFRFSTKYTDSETALSYYGFRYYSPELGRWLNRDPIEERGGVNLYANVGNDAVNRLDLLGLADCGCKTVDANGKWHDVDDTYTTPPTFPNLVPNTPSLLNNGNASGKAAEEALNILARIAAANNYANVVDSGEYRCSQELTVEARKNLNSSGLTDAKPCKYCCVIRIKSTTQELSKWVVYSLESAGLTKSSCSEARNTGAFNPVGIITLYYSPH